VRKLGPAVHGALQLSILNFGAAPRDDRDDEYLTALAASLARVRGGGRAVLRLSNPS
jgi:hypothetical protein